MLRFRADQKVLRTYKILGCRYADGYAEEYRARDLAMRRDVILRCCPLSPPAGWTRSAFAREGSVQAGLAHENIAAVREVLDASGIVVLEAVDAVPLGEIRPARQHILEILIQAARALCYAHEQKVFHQRLSPWNMASRLAAGS